MSVAHLGEKNEREKDELDRRHDKKKRVHGNTALDQIIYTNALIFVNYCSKRANPDLLIGMVSCKVLNAKVKKCAWNKKKSSCCELSICSM